MPSGRIILLNGTSSSGKSTLARLLQHRLPEPYLHVQLDDFIGMLPRHDDSAMFDRMVRGMNRAVLAMAEEENDLIVDHVLVDERWLEQLLGLFRGRYVLFVGLRCGLEELERRERARDARRQGYARQQYERVHQGRIYDVEVDTQQLSPEACAERVLSFFGEQVPRAFAAMFSARPQSDG